MFVSIGPVTKVMFTFLTGVNFHIYHSCSSKLSPTKKAVLKKEMAALLADLGHEKNIAAAILLEHLVDGD